MADYLTTEPPAIIPEFAKEDLTDPTTGLNNVLEPETDQKKWGWFPFRKRPGRRVMNWLHRHTYLNFDFVKNNFFPEVDAGLHDHEDRILHLEGNLPRWYYGSLEASLRLIRDDSNPTYGWQTPTADSECTARVSDRRFLDFTLRWTILGEMFYLSIPECVCTCNLLVHTDCVLEVSGIPVVWETLLKDKQKMKMLAINPPIGSAPCNGYMTFAKADWVEVKWLQMRFENSLAAGTTNEMGDFLLQRSLGAAGLPCQTIVGYCVP